jgi:RNA polymerase sigma factor (sigma-70 family)
MPAPVLRVLGDDGLFRLAAAGDARAFEAIYERHHQALYRYCHSILGNREDAADALQSTMASALRGLAGEQRQIALKPWLFRIAHNECVSLVRKRRPHAAMDDALNLEAPAHDPEVRRRLQELVADLSGLPDAQRGALVMHELNGLSHRDIAAALDVTEPQSRQLVYEARAALHELAEGRAMGCETVRRSISDGDGRVLRGRRIRAHLRACPGCRMFDELIRTRRHDLAAIAPPLPAAMAVGVLHKVLGGGASAGASSASTGLGSIVAGKAVVGSMVAKAAAVVVAAAVAGTGAVEITHELRTSQAPHAGAAAPSSSASPTRNSVSPTRVTPASPPTPAPPPTSGPRSRAPGSAPTDRPAPASPAHPESSRGHAGKTHSRGPAPAPRHPAHPLRKHGTPRAHAKPVHARKPHPMHPVTPTPAKPKQAAAARPKQRAPKKPKHTAPKKPKQTATGHLNHATAPAAATPKGAPQGTHPSGATRSSPAGGLRGSGLK